MGILQARIVEWVAIPFSRRYAQPQDQTQVPHIAGIRILYQVSHQGSPKILKWVQVKVAQSCLTLCDPMDYTVYGTLMAPEWVAISLSTGSSQSRDKT